VTCGEFVKTVVFRSDYVHSGDPNHPYSQKPEDYNALATCSVTNDNAPSSCTFSCAVESSWIEKMNAEALKFGVGGGIFEFRSKIPGFNDWTSSPYIPIKTSNLIGAIYGVLDPSLFKVIEDDSNDPDPDPAVTPEPVAAASADDSSIDEEELSGSSGPHADTASGCSMVPAAHTNLLSWLVAVAALIPIGIRRKK